MQFGFLHTNQIGVEMKKTKMERVTKKNQEGEDKTGIIMYFSMAEAIHSAYDDFQQFNHFTLIRETQSEIHSE